MNESSCRICFTTEIKSPLIPIHLGINGWSPYQKFIKLSLKIEGGSSLICSQCNRELDNAISFVEKCENSNKIIAAKFKKTSWQTHERDFISKDLEIEATEDVEEISDSHFVKSSAVLLPKPQCPHCGSQRRCKHWAPSTTHTCPYCRKEFTRKFNFNIHLKRHVGDDRWPCPACGSEQLSRWRAQRHCRPRARRACPHAACRSSFTTITNLNNHIRTHTGERPYSCAECSKSFASKNTLTVHLRIHTGEKPYMCPVCGKQFANNKLSEHLASHAGKTHSCSIDHCNKTFRSVRSLRLHARTHTHTGARRTHTCAQCGARYAHAQSLRKHARRQHAQRQDETIHASNKEQVGMEASTT